MPSSRLTACCGRSVERRPHALPGLTRDTVDGVAEVSIRDLRTCNPADFEGIDELDVVAVALPDAPG